MAPRPVVPAELRNRPFTLQEARKAGLSKRQLQGENWKRLGGGMYARAAIADSPAVRLAAVRRRVPQAVFSGRTAAWLHGLDIPLGDAIEVTLPAESGVAARAGLSIRRTVLQEGDVVVRRGLPATSALRTVTDLCGRPPLVEAVVVADMALHKRLVSLADLCAYVAAHPGVAGIVQLRRVVDLAEPLAESPMETRLRLVLVLAGLPPPRAQVPLHDHRGRFLGRPDLVYLEQRLGIEYDGGTHRDRLADDDRRQNRLLAAGYRLLRFTAADVLRSPETIVSLVSRQLDTREGAAYGFA